MFILQAFADNTSSQPGVVGGSPMDIFFPILLCMLVFYFLLIRPEQKKKKKHEEQINSLKKGSKIITSGGICGKVIGFKEKENLAVIEIAPSVKIEILKSAISTILHHEEK